MATSAPPHYDFGELQTLAVNSSESVLCAGGLCFDSGTFAGVTTDNMTVSALCHGDSGGPLVEVCDGVPYVVGVTAARIQANEVSTWEQALQAWLGQHHLELETMSAAFAFSQGNICGSGDAIGFVTTRVDAPATYAWIRSVIGSTSAVGDFNSDARADVLRSDPASGQLRMHPGGASGSLPWLRAGLRPGDRIFAAPIDGQASYTLLRVGLPVAGRWTLDRHTWGKETAERLAPIGSKLDAPLVLDDGRAIVYPTGYLASKAPRLAVVADLDAQDSQSLGLMDATRRASFAGMTHQCGDSDILSLTQSGKLLHHFDVACQWDATGTAAQTWEGQVLTVGSHHEIVWVGELPPAMLPGTRDLAADVVMVVRDLDRDGVDTSRMRFFSGRIAGSNYVLDERALVGPHIGADEDVFLARVDDDEALDLVFVARSSAAIEYSLYDPHLVGHGARSSWPWVPAKAPRPRPAPAPAPAPRVVR